MPEPGVTFIKVHHNSESFIDIWPTELGTIVKHNQIMSDWQKEIVEYIIRNGKLIDGRYIYSTKVTLGILQDPTTVPEHAIGTSQIIEHDFHDYVKLTVQHIGILKQRLTIDGPTSSKFNITEEDITDESANVN